MTNRERKGWWDRRSLKSRPPFMTTMQTHSSLDTSASVFQILRQIYWGPASRNGTIVFLVGSVAWVFCLVYGYLRASALRPLIPWVFIIWLCLLIVGLSVRVWRFRRGDY